MLDLPEVRRQLAAATPGNWEWDNVVRTVPALIGEVERLRVAMAVYADHDSWLPYRRSFGPPDGTYLWQGSSQPWDVAEAALAAPVVEGAACRERTWRRWKQNVHGGWDIAEELVEAPDSGRE